MSVVDRISDIDFPDDAGISVLIYGQSGTGKTTFWGTFPDPILVMISSGSFKPGELRSLNTPENKGRIKQVVLHHSSEIKALVAHQKETKKYRTIVLDHVSGLQDQTLREITGWAQLPAQKSYGLISRDQYSQSTSQCKELLRAMIDCQDLCNVVIVGQERNFGNSEENSVDPDISQIAIGVGVTPALANWLQPAVDYTIQSFKRGRFENQEVKVGKSKQVIRQRVKGVDFCVRCEPHDVIATKFRVPLGSPLPDVIVNPTHAKLLSVIQGRGLPEEG